MSSLVCVPANLFQTLAQVHGERGVRWLRDLAEFVAIFAEHCGLSVGPPLEPLFSSYIAMAVLPDGSPAILKATVPTPGLGHEVEALRSFDGRGAVRLIDANLEPGILLLERLEPGTALTELDDDELATSIAADLM
jgi:streptomycin 6-kinase